MPGKKSKTGIQSMVDVLKTKLMKVSSRNVNDEIDQAMARVSDSIIDKDATNYSEMLRRQFSNIIQDKFNFKSMSRDFFQTYLNADRFIRYANSEEIVDCIPYCSRALKVLSDEIVAPDDISKGVLQVIQEESETEGSKINADNIKKIIKSLGVEDHIHNIVYETLKLGDQFIEICDYTDEDIPLTQSILNEAGVDFDPDNPDMTSIPNGYQDVFPNEVEITWAYQNITETGELIEARDEDKKVFIVKPVIVEAIKKTKTKEVPINNVRLVVHDPRYIIKLQSQRFKMCLGYLILPRQEFGNSSVDGKTNYLKSMTYGMNDYRDMTGIDKLYSEILGLVKRHLTDSKKDMTVNKNELMNMLSRCIKEMEDDQKREFKVRYVPADRMEHFVISNRRFFPYGEGIFYKTTFSSKLLIALETAVTIKRITDSVDSRIFYVETGVPRNARDILEDVREARNKKKISIDKFGSVGSIPSMITSYEDYYVPQNNGKRYIEFETLPPTNSVRDLTEELKYFRDVLVSALEVPPAYIGLEENISNKCLDLFTKIPLMNGKTVTLKELIDEYEQSGMIKNKYTYSYDKETGNIVPGKISWASKTRLNTNVVEVLLDNGEKIIATPDHKFMLRNGEYKEAQYLEKNESLMPWYTRLTHFKTTTKKIPYQEIYHPGLDSWEYTHRVVAKHEGYIVDKIKSNIITCGNKESYKHSFIDFNNTPKRKKLAIESGKLGGSVSAERLGKWVTANLKDNKWIDIKEGGKSGDGMILNHKVVSVTILEQRMDTGDITVDTYHNFATSAGVIVSNSALSFENILFARTIVSYQSVLSKNLCSLFNKLNKFIYGQGLSPDMKITFSPPRMLHNEREAEHMRTVSDLITTLSELGIDKEYLKKKYLPLDWAKIKEFEVASKLKDQLQDKSEEEKAAMMGGGY